MRRLVDHLLTAEATLCDHFWRREKLLTLSAQITKSKSPLGIGNVLKKLAWSYQAASTLHIVQIWAVKKI